MLSEIQYRFLGRYRELAIVLLLTVLAFAVRVYRVDFNSLSEDESAKWAAVQEYRHGHFVGVNSEHPMLPKMLAWASLTAGERWSRVAAAHGWPSLKPEGWLTYAQRAVRRSRSCSSFSFMPPNDGACGIFCSEFLLGGCATASRVKSTHERGNAAHFLHSCWPVTSIAAPNRQMRTRVHGDGTT